VSLENFFRERPGLIWALGFQIVFSVVFTMMFFYFDGRAPYEEKRVRLEDVVYNPATHYVTGRVVNANDPGKYGVIVYIRPNDSSGVFFPKPFENQAVQPVAAHNGMFSVQAYSINEPGDKTAQYFCVLLVPADLKYELLIREAGGQSKNVWDVAREKAIDEKWNELTNNQEGAG